jgi:iron complex outermembrane receptor protein
VQSLFGAATAHPSLELHDLATLSLDQLSNIVVTTVSRHEQSLGSAAASIYVITANDIRRSGATTLPEALRLAPNLVVARADVNQYAISAGGFNNTLANRMLVMIDGRIVYSPLYSGVFWEVQDLMLQDVERIEVISGPGSALWSPNAVNGVINVITRRADDTQGTLADIGIGNRSRQAAARYGGRFGEDGYYRVYGKTQHFNQGKQADGTAVDDASERSQGGFRLDWGDADNGTTVQGDLYTNTIDQPVGGARDLAGGNLIARRNRLYDDGASWRLETYYDHVERSQPGLIWENLDTLNLDFQYGLAPLAAHRVLWGASYSHSRDWLVNLAPAVLAFVPASRNLDNYHILLQDEWQLRPRLALTLGVKGEHNDYTGMEWLPTARLAWNFTPDHLLWAALSRAVRAPSRIDREVYVPGTPPYLLAGGSSFQSEVAEVYQLGYRAQPTPRLSYSASVYYYSNDRLRSLVPGGPFINQFEGDVKGLEAWGSYQATPHWRLDAGWLELRENLHPAPGSPPDVEEAILSNDPRRQITLRSMMDISGGYELDIMARYVGELPNPQVPAYSAVDARLGWLASRHLRLSLLLQNLFDPSHPEWGAEGTREEFPRSIFLEAEWRS